MWTWGLDAPDRFSRMNIPGTHLPTTSGWTAELAGGYVWKQFRRLGSNPGLSASQRPPPPPVPTLRFNRSATLTTSSQRLIKIDWLRCLIFLWCWWIIIALRYLKLQFWFSEIQCEGKSWGLLTKYLQKLHLQFGPSQVLIKLFKNFKDLNRHIIGHKIIVQKAENVLLYFLDFLTLFCCWKISN